MKGETKLLWALGDLASTDGPVTRLTHYCTEKKTRRNDERERERKRKRKVY